MHDQTSSFPLKLIFHGTEGDENAYIFSLGNVIVDTTSTGYWEHGQLLASRWRR